ncbi:LLM class flavin-dependent oxidoreductase [Faecalibacter rhinopitheci]|uniref:Luciferase-like monooxygenase n=1 Tax=Faecalibacter rhinopitheci TaxID=2779678 RepID=A0A8J7KI61_9FLAO|nr:LLM class flavin-dependent oxidoreductase [Faecalibacter rhinopitheci]MBF0597201.1 LLM class flavin-dependent oxidoreductase [Faecalibacter rhinopitheci]
MDYLKNIKYSVLDLAVVRKGDSLTETFQNTVDNASFVEELGYTRYWLSEHHNMENVASSATSVLIGHVAGKTKKIRVGSGGVMLPNHTALNIAEQFGTLDALYPNRIDLGLGRAPGTDQLTASILRRGDNFANYNFQLDIKELQRYISVDNRENKVRAIPGEGAQIDIYILGSSIESAYLAAKMGLPYAFAGHFAPQQFYSAIEIYKENFIPSKYLEKPYTMACINVIASTTDDEAHYLSLSMYQSFLNIITDQRSPLVAPEETNLQVASDQQKMVLKNMTGLSFIGSKSTLCQTLSKFIDESGVNEIIVSSNIFDQKAKRKSYQIISELFK